MSPRDPILNRPNIIYSLQGGGGGAVARPAGAAELKGPRIGRQNEYFKRKI
jgi:hypothetical protein